MEHKKYRIYCEHCTTSKNYPKQSTESDYLNEADNEGYIANSDILKEYNIAKHNDH